jgi:hypothetical protein
LKLLRKSLKYKHHPWKRQTTLRDRICLDFSGSDSKKGKLERSSAIGFSALPVASINAIAVALPIPSKN